MKKIFIVFLLSIFIHVEGVYAEDCQSFSKSKVFPTNNISLLRMVKQRAESCSVYYAGVIMAIKNQKEVLLEELVREPKNKAIRRVFEKADKELMLALLTEAELNELKVKMKEQIEELRDPELPKIRTEM